MTRLDLEASARHCWRNPPAGKRLPAEPTLFGRRAVFRLVLLVALALVLDLAGYRAGHVQLVDVQGGLAERGHGRVHACIAV